MKNRNLKATMLGMAIAAITGVAFAQSPAAPATDRGAAGADKSSGSIIERQTEPPRSAGTSSASQAETKGGKGAGASELSTGNIVDRQTKPSTSGSASGEPTSRTTDVTSGRIVDEQTKPGAGKMDPAQRGGTTR